MKKILLTDDSKTVTKLLACFLSNYESEEFDIFSAKDGADALFILNDNDIDIIFLDINMPIVDGYGVASFISDRELNIDIVVITSNLDKGTVTALGKMGVKNFLPKPIRYERMKDILDKLILGGEEKRKLEKLEARKKHNQNNETCEISSELE